jgi:hypothetical protein
MDLSTIKAKLSGAMYGSAELFITDLRLVFDNCRMFNAPDSDICEVAARLTALSERLIAGWLTSAESPALADLDDDRCQVLHHASMLLRPWLPPSEAGDLVYG